VTIQYLSVADRVQYIIPAAGGWALAAGGEALQPVVYTGGKGWPDAWVTRYRSPRRLRSNFVVNFRQKNSQRT